jgi:hypothetical protein
MVKIPTLKILAAKIPAVKKWGTAGRRRVAFAARRAILNGSRSC